MVNIKNRKFQFENMKNLHSVIKMLRQTKPGTQRSQFKNGFDGR